MVEAKVFKAYDIRGLYPTELNTDLAYKLAKAFVLHLEKKQNLKKVAIAYDMRESSLDLLDSLKKGFKDIGVDIVNLGLSTTPLLYFSVAYLKDVDAGIMITASHNPAEFNGFKMVDKDLLPIGENNGIKEIKDIILNNENLLNLSRDNIDFNYEELDLKNEYLDYIFSLINVKFQKKYKVAIDIANGAVASIINDFVSRFDNLEISKLYWELDGSFPNHEANPLKHETLKDLQKLILDNSCDLGIAFDGDGDRVVFVDDKANIWSGDYITAVLAKNIVKNNSESLVLYDLRSSDIVKEKILEYGAKAEESRVGHAFIKAMMKEKQVIFAGELSSHFYYSDFFNVESALLTVLRFLGFMERDLGNNKLSDFYNKLKKYYHSGEINLKINLDKKDQIFNDIVNFYQTGTIDKAQSISYLDGLKIKLKNWWFNLRFSNTEALLRINMEAKTEDLLYEKKEELFSLLNKYF